MNDVNQIQANNGRVFDSSIVLKENAMLKKNPELFYEWNFEKNDELELDIYDVTFGSSRVRVWWICPACESDYDMTPKNKCKGQNCPYCAGRRVNHTNSLASLRPDVASQWHPTRNGNLTPDDVIPNNTSTKVWWLGECGHEWDSLIRDRCAATGCRYCAPTNASLLKGFNDMWTTNPELASMLADPEDGYRYMQNSDVKLDWECQQCGHILKGLSPCAINTAGLSCPRCADGRSYPEKFMYNLLTDLGVQFETEKIFDWLLEKRYDFYLPDHNCIIEVHGEQHYNRIKGMFFSDVTLETSIENDELKLKSAKENGIENYIVIDARKSTLNFISKNIEESGLLKLLGISLSRNIDWSRYNKNSLPSFVKIASTMWENGMYHKDIADKLNISGVTLTKYLQKGAAAGFCAYGEGKKRMPPNPSLNKKIVQLSMNGQKIKEWESIIVAAGSFGAKTGNTISSALTGRYKTAYNFIWVYLDQYNSSDIENIVKSRQLQKTRGVVQLNLEGEYVAEWGSIREAQQSLKKKKSNISECCRGTRSTSHGFKWMYKEDYHKKGEWYD